MSKPIDQARELFEQMGNIADDEKCIELLAAALIHKPAAVTVPNGWKLVPIEPTADMVNAFKDRVGVTSRGGLLNTGHALTAAIRAAPHPVSGEKL